MRKSQLERLKRCGIQMIDDESRIIEDDNYQIVMGIITNET